MGVKVTLSKIQREIWGDRIKAWVTLGQNELSDSNKHSQYNMGGGGGGGRSQTSVTFFFLKLLTNEICVKAAYDRIFIIKFYWFFSLGIQGRENQNKKNKTLLGITVRRKMK